MGIRRGGYALLGVCALLCAACSDDDAAGGSFASAESDYAGWGGYDAGSWGGGDVSAGPDAGQAGGGNTNVNLGGVSDIGFFRALLDSGTVPQPEDITAEGFFAEHHTPLPEPVCGERICLQALFGVMGNLINGNNCTLLQLGLNSPLRASPAERPPLNLTVVVDVSGSMEGGNKIGFVQEGLGMLIDSMHDEDSLAIVTYSDQVRVEAEMAVVSGSRHTLREIAESLIAQGGTNLYAGLEEGYAVARDAYDSGRQNRVILLSDGQPTSGVTDSDRIMSMSRDHNSDGIGLTTIGLGTDFNAALMQGLARLGDGNFYFVEDASAVEEVFVEEISYFTVPVAFDLDVDVTISEHYTLQAARGSTFWEDSAEGGFLSIPSVFLAHRESDEDVTPDGGRRGGGSALLLELMPRERSDDGSGMTETPVATVSLTFREPGSDELISESLDVTYPRAPWVVEPTGFFSAPDLAIVHKSFVMLNIFVGIQSACQAFHLGAPEESLGILQRLLAAVADYNEEVADVDIEYDIELIEQLISVIEANGGSEPEDPEVPEDPWPAD